MLEIGKILTFDDPVLLKERKFRSITADLTRYVNSNPGFYWYLGMGISFCLMVIGFLSAYNTVYWGIGLWGLNQTVGWGMSITNFIWWIGIGHAGTFISAILLLFHQKWRTSVNRIAETMTLLALMCAAFFPIIHLGRHALAFFTFPYPNTRNLTVNFTSPLVWDVFAISTYFIVSLLFWYIGLLPDLATLRDKSKTKFSRWFYNTISLRWNGSYYDWRRFELLNYYMACIATPLVISVHSVVSLDFATSLVPGWHSTIFPPYFVAGAIFSGFAMVQTILIITRKVLSLEKYILPVHIEFMNKIILITGSIVALAYFTETYFFLYSDNIVENDLLSSRFSGKNSLVFYLTILFNIVFPQLLWSQRLRRNIVVTFFIVIFINIGMWFERYNIVIGSLTQDYLPSKWTTYLPSLTETGLFAGTFGFFFFFLFLSLKIFPAVSILDTKKGALTGTTEEI